MVPIGNESRGTDTGIVDPRPQIELRDLPYRFVIRCSRGDH
jgi:hypothetical protein